MMLRGRVWKFGDEIGATDLVSARYDKEGMARKWDECAKHVLEDMDPAFAASVRKGDILLAGENFGNGHAHYYMTAIMGCSAAGLAALLAESFNGLFLRAAIDAGVPAWSFKGLSSLVNSGENLELDLQTGVARNLTSGKTKQFDPVSDIVLGILAAGGSRNWALRRVGAEHAI